LQAAMASSERIFGLLDEPVSIQSPLNPKHRPAPAKGRIVFEHVWFSYSQAGTSKDDKNRGDPSQEHGDDELDYVLRDVSFEVKPGERVGIVGATGSGKTTLISLL